MSLQEALAQTQPQQSQPQNQNQQAHQGSKPSRYKGQQQQTQDTPRTKSGDDTGRGGGSGRGQRGRGRGRGRGSASSQRPPTNGSLDWTSEAQNNHSTPRPVASAPSTQNAWVSNESSESANGGWDTPLPGGALLPTPTDPPVTMIVNTSTQQNTSSESAWRSESVHIDWNTPSVPPNSQPDAKAKQPWAGNEWDAQSRGSKNTKNWSTPESTPQNTQPLSATTSGTSSSRQQTDPKSFFTDSMIWKNESTSTPISSTSSTQHTKFNATSSDKSKGPVTLPTHIEKLSIEESPFNFGSFQAGPNTTSKPVESTVSPSVRSSEQAWAGVNQAQAFQQSQERSPPIEPPKTEHRTSERPASQERPASKSASPSPSPPPTKPSIAPAPHHHHQMQQPMLPFYPPQFYMPVYTPFQYPMSGQYGSYSAPPKYSQGHYQQTKGPNQQPYHHYPATSYPPPASSGAGGATYPYEQPPMMDPSFSAMDELSYAPAPAPYYPDRLHTGPPSFTKGAGNGAAGGQVDYAGQPSYPFMGPGQPPMYSNNRF
eukprot:c7130_g1_i2.p1 GENE.c7130_g1_i2~~c7130_g1_i2.p1  ORF type:complete len:541 (-),score=59.70 c7130_g1_i2:84-1706(-)